jgi:hypothetical protein
MCVLADEAKEATWQVSHMEREIYTWRRAQFYDDLTITLGPQIRRQDLRGNVYSGVMCEA